MASSWRHWAMLAALALSTAGTYFCIDIPAATNVSLRERLAIEYRDWQLQLNLMYTVYSAPNIILPLLGGVFVTNLGASRVVLIFSTLVLAGMVLFLYGVYSRRLLLLHVGRAVAGIGAGTLDAAQMSLIHEWFAVHPTFGVSLAMALDLAFIRGCNALNDVVSPWLTESYGVEWAALLGVGVCCVSVTAALAVLCLDTSGSRERGGFGLSGLSESPSLSSINSDDTVQIGTDVEYIAPEDQLKPTERPGEVLQTPGGLTVQTRRVLMLPTFEKPLHLSRGSGRSHPSAITPTSLNASGFSARPTSWLSRQSGISSASVMSHPMFGVAPSHTPIHDQMESPRFATPEILVVPTEATPLIRDDVELYSRFPALEKDPLQSLSLTLLCITSVATFGGVYPFFNVCSDLFQERWYRGDAKTAGLAMALPVVMGVLFVPPIGFFADRNPHLRPQMMVVGLSLIATAHLLVGWTATTPFAAMSLLGLGFSIETATIWPMVPAVVGANCLASSYGVLIVCNNIGLTALPMVVAMVRAHFVSWSATETVFVATASVGLASSLFLARQAGFSTPNEDGLLRSDQSCRERDVL